MTNIAVTVTESTNTYLTYPCEGLLELFEVGLAGYVNTAVFRLWDGQKLSAPVQLPNARWSYSPETAAEIQHHPGPTTNPFLAVGRFAHRATPKENTATGELNVWIATLTSEDSDYGRPDVYVAKTEKDLLAIIAKAAGVPNGTDLLDWLEQRRIVSIWDLYNTPTVPTLIEGTNAVE